MNQEEYQQIVNDCADALYRFSFKNIKVIEEAKEIVQNSFEKLWIHREKIEFQRAKSFLFTTAYRNCIDIIRKQKNESALDMIKSEPQQYLNTHVIGLKALLDNALSQLNELQRSAILLRDYEGYSYLEIGDILDLNESQVKIQIFRGRKKLQNIIGSVEDIL